MTDEANVVTARAAVFRGPGQPLVLEQFPLPTLAAGDALVSIRCATICGSDLHTFHGRRPAPTPSVLGHEMVGVVVELGPQGAFDYHGNRLSYGDRVTWSMVWSCGECFYCQRGLRPKCERLRKFGHEAITGNNALFGGLAQFCHLPAKTAIFRVPPDLPDLVVSPANCATATVAAVFRHAGEIAGQHIVIHGAGMLGLTACAMAAAKGAGSVIVIEPGRRRRETALTFGANHVFDSNESDEALGGKVRELTAGRGADIGLELCGQPGAIETGIQLLRPGGRFVMAGATFPARPAQVSGEQVVKHSLALVGVYNYLPEDLECALRFLSEQHEPIPFGGLVEKSFSLQEVNEAFEYATVSHAPRVAVLPNDGCEV